MHNVPFVLSLGAKAAASGVVANVILGTSSIYWKALSGIPHETLLLYRILISLITLAAVITIRGDICLLASSMSLRLFFIHALAAILVVINWGTFIWASINGHILESGLGYLLAPFVAIAVGAIALSDRIGLTRIIALAIIAFAIGYLFQSSGELAHWVYFTIGATWGGYACLKKWTTLNAFNGLFIETAVLALFIPLLILVFPVTLSPPLTATYAQLALLVLCGFVSVVPLALFSFSASHLPLSMMGLFQFVLPSTQLVVALAVYRQSVSQITLFCFSVIWLSLALIVVEPLIRTLKLKQIIK